jgi:hypothetical protein
MKTIELKVLQDEKLGELTTRKMIEVCLDTPPKDGFTLKDYRKRNRIQDALDKSNGHLELEDNDYAELKVLANNAGWKFRHSFISDFLESFENQK